MISCAGALTSLALHVLLMTPRVDRVCYEHATAPYRFKRIGELGAGWALVLHDSDVH